jgi:hypothetical protein
MEQVAGGGGSLGRTSAHLNVLRDKKTRKKNLEWKFQLSISEFRKSEFLSWFPGQVTGSPRNF